MIASNDDIVIGGCGLMQHLGRCNPRLLTRIHKWCLFQLLCGCVLYAEGSVVVTDERYLVTAKLKISLFQKQNVCYGYEFIQYRPVHFWYLKMAARNVWRRSQRWMLSLAQAHITVYCSVMNNPFEIRMQKETPCEGYQLEMRPLYTVVCFPIMN